ncbi:sortase [Microlunatus soli]|uniref:Sortase A n=1 Tax=Microlunatus soli TaxID=630515 RepID=A0A1H1YEZ2_9ACTN|nr:class E sortase [Microlunatus soli]SDT19951.1 sortase A [Microlunatus soli]
MSIDSPQPNQRRPRWWKRILIGGPILAVVAVGPWLIPWDSITGRADAQQPTVLRQLESPGPDSGSSRAASPADEAPDDQAVRDVTERMSSQGSIGYDLPVSPADLSAVKTKPGPYVKLGRLRVPAINLDVPYGEGVFAKTLEKGPGHWPGTPMPGHRGNAVISGHRNTHTQPFKYLNLLKPGNKIISTYGKEDPVSYRVQKTTIVPEAKFKDFVVEQPSDDNAKQITLFACHPEGNPIYRIVVRAEAE